MSCCKIKVGQYGREWRVGIGKVKGWCWMSCCKIKEAQFGRECRVGIGKVKGWCWMWCYKIKEDQCGRHNLVHGSKHCSTICRSAIIRHFYHARCTLSGWWLVLENCYSHFSLHYPEYLDGFFLGAWFFFFFFFWHEKLEPELLLDLKLLSRTLGSLLADFQNDRLLVSLMLMAWPVLGWVSLSCGGRPIYVKSNKAHMIVQSMILREKRKNNKRERRRNWRV